MIDPDVRAEILRELDRLSPPLQQRALEVVRSLGASQPRGASVEDLLSLGGLLDKDSAREMREAVEKHGA